MFAFLSGRPCLDLTTTLQVRHRTPVETLRSPQDARDWIEQAGLAEEVAVGDDGLVRLRELREVIHRLARAALGATCPDPADVRRLNDAAAHPPTVPRLTGGAARHRGDLDQVLSTIARDAIDLLAGPYAGRIRECAHADCSRLFLDASHAGRRRWCGMAACGNKSKSAAYRRRTRGGADHQATRPSDEHSAHS
ncbi:CGNR zinc finger domain-containing protein [Actinoallomurus soli]|uniref:CGNR zinc finger domain-containing protein n=1 Tax=Actinoallomurus soli TaxID=2952535 RepID=UPI002092C539|nr:ABATE domain-containing protein [Actinoallomurus soli]MCO5971284.1 ABATE domain-containing protein [Actinoallomurus soli]